MTALRLFPNSSILHDFIEKFITQDEYENAKNEKVTFLPQQVGNINAPHFVFFIKDYLEKKYGTEAVENGGLKVTTTLDFYL